MKSAKDPRHLRRRKAVQQLFAESFTKQDDRNDLAKGVLKIQSKLRAKISKSAPQWPIDKLNRIDLAILELATYEIMETDTPPKVVIDEAVELAKEFGGESSPSFVNGVLGDILKKIENKNDEEHK